MPLIHKRHGLKLREIEVKTKREDGEHTGDYADSVTLTSDCSG